MILFRPKDFWMLAAGLTLLIALAANPASGSSTAAYDAYLVKDIYPGSLGSEPEYFAEFNGQLFFAAADPMNGYEPWVTDGTEAGTYMVKDIYPGSNSSNPYHFTQLGAKLLFTARDSTNGYELWVTDGTEAGTQMVKDIYPGSGDSHPRYLTKLVTDSGPKLFFRADDGTNGVELWAVEGQLVVSDVSADPNPAPVGIDITLTATVEDFGMDESTIAGAEYSLDDGNWVPMDALDGLFNDPITEKAFAPIAAFQVAGVHDVCIRGWDSNNNQTAEECLFVVAYDPDGGFVTGGGWIWSPEGACQLDWCDENTTGKANFGFVSKYKQGATVPTGQTEFQFKAGDLNFHSDSYHWLVVAGAKAMYKGVGTINGSGNYGFKLTAIDAEINDNDSFDTDRFRIKIWDKDDGDFVVYDNEMGIPDDEDPTTEIGGGSIIIHKDETN